MQLHSLFPVPVGIFDLQRDFAKEELNFLANLPQGRNDGNDISIASDILDSVELAEIRSFIDDSIAKYIENVYAPKEGVSAPITQSWANYTNKGQWHHKHNHPNSFVSGVLYVQANKEHDKIMFYKDGYQQLKIPPQSFNTFNSDSWWFGAHSGMLILFPSSLQHMVPTVDSDYTRISIAFNTFLSGVIGDKVSMTQVHLADGAPVSSGKPVLMAPPRVDAPPSASSNKPI